MHNIKFHIFLLSVSFFITACTTTANYDRRADVQAFVNQMNTKHGFDHQELRKLFSEAQPMPSIIQAMEKPPEGKKTPWYKYRAIFLTPERTKEGAKFWRENANVLSAVEKKYGVPAQIIVAIIGVETRYGQNKGNYRVWDALTNLAFDYPRRAKFFQGELEQYLLLTRDQGLDPLKMVGSCAGAIGLPQFMPSSYRHYGIDFVGDHQIDLINDPADVIASVANYFKLHGWQTGEPVAVRAKVVGNSYHSFLCKSLKPKWSLQSLGEQGVTPLGETGSQNLATLMLFEGKAETEYWLGFKNFYVITKYNSSRYYAMAVYQLSQKILEARQEGL